MNRKEDRTQNADDFTATLRTFSPWNARHRCDNLSSMAQDAKFARKVTPPYGIPVDKN
jgi:hypothetical protein